jgi:hypothetical protein
VQSKPKEDEALETDDFEESSESEVDDVASGYEEESIDDVSEDESEEGVEPSEEEAPRRPKSGGPNRRNQGSKGATSSTSKGKKVNKDVSRPGNKTGLGPGTQVIIKKPRARSPGDTPYTDETIHPNTMLFLEDLAANNDRQWLKSMLLAILANLKVLGEAKYLRSARSRLQSILERF